MRRVARDHAVAGEPPIAMANVYSWWGTNPKTLAPRTTSMSWLPTPRKQLVLCECRYCASFDETAELADLDSKRGLGRGHLASYVVLFTRFPTSTEARAKSKERDDVMLVSLEYMCLR
jgi:hypothetical protein